MSQGNFFLYQNSRLYFSLHLQGIECCRFRCSRWTWSSNGKTLGALNYSYMYAKYGSEADYFLKADDDTYVITENLQLTLSRFHSISLLYLGNLFTKILPKGYNSGGAGYILSNQAAKLLLRNRTLYPSECREDGGNEDVEIGRCLAKLSVYPQDYLDSAGKQFLIQRILCVFFEETNLVQALIPMST